MITSDSNQFGSMSETRLCVGNVVAALPLETEVLHLTMSGTFCCFASPGLLTFYDWSVKSSVLTYLPSDAVTVIGLCSCQSKSGASRRVFGLMSNGQILCWRHDTDSMEIQSNHLYTYDEADWSREITPEAAYLIADEASDLLVVIIPNRFLHIFSLRLNQTLFKGCIDADGSTITSLVHCSLKLQFKPLQHYSRSSSDAVCRMWSLFDADAEVEEVTVCMGTEAYLDLWKIDRVVSARTIVDGNSDNMGNTTALRIPTKHKSWITAITSGGSNNSTMPTTMSADAPFADRSIMITGDASGGIIVWKRGTLRHSQICAMWYADKKRAEDENKAAALAETLKATIRAVEARKGPSHDRRTPPPSRERQTGQNGKPAGAKWNMPPEKSPAPRSTSSSPKRTKRSASPAKKTPTEDKSEESKSPPETPGPTAPDDLTISGLEEYVVACDFGAAGPITALLVSGSLQSIWVADASGAITAATLDLQGRTLVRSRRLVVNSLGWAADLFWQHDERSCEGILRYVERNRGIVVECTVHDRLSSVFQTSPEVDTPLTAGHRSLVHCCAFLAEWGLLLTAGFNPTVDVWDVRSGRSVCTLEVPSQRVSTLAIHNMSDIAVPETSSTSTPPTTDPAAEHRASPSIRLLTGHSTGEVHLFCLSLNRTEPPRMAASLVHSAVHSPMPVTDIILSKKGTVAAICYARVCVVLHDCESNHLLRELNFESPLSCIHRVEVVDINPYLTSALADAFSSHTLERGKSSASNRPGLRTRSNMRHRDDHLVVGLQSNRLVKVLDLLGGGEAITTVEFGTRPDSGAQYTVIEGFMWQASVAVIPTEASASPTTRQPGANLVGMVLSQRENSSNYLPDVLCFRKLSMAASAVDTEVVKPPTAIILSAGRDMRTDEMDGTAMGLRVTHFLVPDSSSDSTASSSASSFTVAAVWSMRKVFIIKTLAWPKGEAEATAVSKVLHVCYVPDRKVHVVCAKVIADSTRNLMHTANASAVVVLSDGNAMTLSIDVS